MKKQTILLKSPFGYYGGKQLLAKRIISLIPPHKSYIEPFFGGGAIYFGKEPSAIEIINDTNSELINFYKILKYKFKDLQRELETCLHSRSLHKHATVIMDNPDMFSDVKRAWALFIRATQGFASMLDSPWGYDRKTNQTPRAIKNKILQLTEEYQLRLQSTQIENTDALRVIKSRDFEKAFFYCDPPYFNSNCGHYDGYSKEDFTLLLETLKNIDGKFLMSSYKSDILSKYIKENNWCSIHIEMPVSVSKKGKRKIEVLSANYPISLEQ